MNDTDDVCPRKVSWLWINERVWFASARAVGRRRGGWHPPHGSAAGGSADGSAWRPLSGI
jgi:hypothetical protein